MSIICKKSNHIKRARTNCFLRSKPIEEGTGRQDNKKSLKEREYLNLLYLDCLCFSAPRISSLFSFFPVCLSVRVFVGVEAWRAFCGGQWGYLWFIYGHSSKKPVDAASLSHPLCPSHCFSIGLPLCPWHTGKRCHPAHDPTAGTLLAKRMNRDQSHSAVLAPHSSCNDIFCLFLHLYLYIGSPQNQ